MTKLACAAVLLGVLAFGCDEDEEETPSAFDQLVEGLGGPADLDALTGLRIEGSGVRNIPNEGELPSNPPIEANSFERTVSLDLSGDALRVDTAKTVEFLFPGMITYYDVVRGDLGASTEPFGGMPLGALGSDKTAAIRRQETLLAPQLLLRGLTAASFTTEPDVQVDGVTQHRLVLAGAPKPITLFVDAATGTLTKLETMELDFYMRDVKLEVFFSEWAAAGNINFPRKVRLARGGNTLFTEDVGEIAVNPAFAAGTFDFPGGATPALDQALFDRGEQTHQWYYLLDSVGLPFSGIDTTITPKVLAPGVQQLMGNSHHSFVVEQANGIVLVDAPFHEDRGKALSEYIAATFPGKPISHVVASHFHEDHVSGIREVLGSNPDAKLVVHESTEATWRAILAAPSTLRPDALARAPREVEIVTVPDAGSFTLADATNPLTLYPVQTEHAADLLMAHHAASNTVFVVDIYSPGFTAQLNADDFKASLATHAIPTANLQIVGGHGPETHDYDDVLTFAP
jgi:glyoxylase-like metal-dependent hydrolase (beta-lactamase superfamily II)